MPPYHQAHDYKALVTRWRRAAARHGLRLRPLAEENGHTAYSIVTPTAGSSHAIYVSAGIHGDEPGSTEGFILWAERTKRDLSRLPLIMIPCLNPWGLTSNSRLDPKGRDLNRGWNRSRSKIVRAAKQLIASRRFRLALTLHEDFDATGVYLYEPARKKPYWGERLLQAVENVIPRDQRPRIEGRKAPGALLRKKIGPDSVPESPEAVYLHLHHAERTFTFETPSEFHIDDRARSQYRFLEAALNLWEKEKA